jgi:transcriptional regulator NrdR family protein
MNCPKCGYSYSRAIDSRHIGKEQRVRKRCGNCGSRFTVYEVSDLEYKRLKKQEKTIAKILSLMEVLKKIENEDN